MANMVEILDRMTAPAALVEKQEGETVRCLACAHRCVLLPGRRGICQMRFNDRGTLRIPWGYVAAAQVDPIEKKPFNHFLPGNEVLTIGMLGCNFHCDFCQNWLSSQMLRDSHAVMRSEYLIQAGPEALEQAAQRSGAQIIASSYNEPMITAEWAEAIFARAKAAGLSTAMVSNGYTTPQTLHYLRPHLDALKVDLKSMQEANYHAMGGRLQPVLDTIKLAREIGLWVEVVTLVIPGFNDTPEELWEAARFIASVSPEIPWHVTAFHPDYKRLDAPPTDSEKLQQAADIGQEAGLLSVYAGNLPGRVGSLEDTHCPRCGELLIQRRGYTLFVYRITADGKCSKCGTPQAGIWTDKPDQVRLRGKGIPRYL